ncbi:PAAR-like domain-containing protein [Nannocystis pusilla]|uniref:PAAR-like domain-containing protein n=1 Tax=Nannocystis pusilla TaxID=889268 RepID=UPI003B7DDC96
MPYVNAAQDSQLAGGSKRTAIEGNAIALASSNLRTSTGDEPGTAGGGLMSNKVKGKLTWGSSSPDVLVEGKGVVRFMDVTQHNGNSFNTAFMEQGGTGFAYGDDFERECPCARRARRATRSRRRRPKRAASTSRRRSCATSRRARMRGRRPTRRWRRPRQSWSASSR